MAEGDHFTTEPIKGYKYCIADVDQNALTVNMSNEGSLVEVGLKLTAKGRIKVSTWKRPDEISDSYYITDKSEYKEVEELVGKARKFIVQSKQPGIDVDDLSYDMMCFVGKIFVDFTNEQLNEGLEEALKL